MTLRRLEVIVDGTPHTVEIEDPGVSPMTVRVNGRTFRVEVREGEEVVAGPEPSAPRPAAAPPGPAAAPSESPVAAGDSHQVIAPMPGTILEVLVAPGDHVSYRQDLCILEAMKMKNAIRSPKDGVIAEVRVQPNQTVAYGDILFTFE
jgi:biotin carboxyl carrier protein